MAFRKPQAWLLAAIFFYFLFFFHLSATGMLAPDEPRYASVGREMARSGDWVTPRLWGEPWFEKPALLYWMEGAAFRLGVRFGIDAGLWAGCDAVDPEAQHAPYFQPYFQRA